jgi:hypothetical protein
MLVLDVQDRITVPQSPERFQPPNPLARFPNALLLCDANAYPIARFTVFVCGLE